jgi:predicted alpha/beta-hydrolase family hydrolase
MATEVRIDPGDGSEVSGLLEEAPAPFALGVVAHGAGAGMRTTILEGVSAGLASSGVSCLRFDFPFVEAGRRAPDRPAVLLETWRAALASAKRWAGGRPLMAGGKSLGGRMASVLAAEMGGAFPAAALVFFGYPLHAPGRTDRLRDEHLLDVRVPMLFIQGTSDPLARSDLVKGLVERLSGRARLHVVEGGDHSFRVRGTPRADQDVGSELGAVAAAFVLDVIG